MRALRPDVRTIYFFCALGGLLFGYDTGVISGAVLPMLLPRIPHRRLRPNLIPRAE